MEIKNIDRGKKLNKKELRTIAGGLKRCLVNGQCIIMSTACAEPECNPIVLPEN